MVIKCLIRIFSHPGRGGENNRFIEYTLLHIFVQVFVIIMPDIINIKLSFIENLIANPKLRLL